MKQRRKSHVKRKPSRTPKIKKVRLTEDVALQVDVPHGHVPVPFIIPDSNPQTMVIAAAPAKKVRETWMQYFFGPERK